MIVRPHDGRRLAGCTVNLVSRDQSDAFAAGVKKVYKAAVVSTRKRTCLTAVDGAGSECEGGK